MNPFVARISDRPAFSREKWILPVTAMSLVLGFMISVARVTETNRSSRFGLFAEDGRGRAADNPTADTAANQQLSDQVKKLQAEKTALENAVAGQGDQTKVLNSGLQETKAFAGLTPLEGPGVSVTLRDSSKGGLQVNGATVFTPDSNIHDLDVLRIVNELYNAGAEAVAVGKERLSSTSNIRCVGSTIMVNDVKIAPPIVVRAIGDAQTLLGALNINGGVVSEIRTQDPSMIEVAAVKSMQLPAFTGKTSFRYGKVLKGTP